MLTSLGLLYFKSMKSGCTGLKIDGAGLNFGGSGLDIDESIDLSFDFSLFQCIEKSLERTLKRSYALPSSWSHFLISSVSCCFLSFRSTPLLFERFSENNLMSSKTLRG
jgi:hypothetical protein